MAYYFSLMSKKGFAWRACMTLSVKERKRCPAIEIPEKIKSQFNLRNLYWSPTLCRQSTMCSVYLVLFLTESNKMKSMLYIHLRTISEETRNRKLHIVNIWCLFHSPNHSFFWFFMMSFISILRPWGGERADPTSTPKASDLKHYDNLQSYS